MIRQGDSVEAGDLLVRMEEGEEPEDPIKNLDPEDVEEFEAFTAAAPA